MAVIYARIRDEDRDVLREVAIDTGLSMAKVFEAIVARGLGRPHPLTTPVVRSLRTIAERSTPDATPHPQHGDASRERQDGRP